LLADNLESPYRQPLYLSIETDHDVGPLGRHISP
jgi:hypothetical protein